jgi:hypothetical protein
MAGASGYEMVAHMTHSDASRKQHHDQMVEMPSWQTERYEAKRTGKAYSPTTWAALRGPSHEPSERAGGRAGVVRAGDALYRTRPTVYG